MADQKNYVRTDADGVMRVGARGVPIDGVIAAFEIGDSPEAIRSQYPALELEEVYGAIAYYLANRQEIAEYLKRQDEVWAYWRSRFEKNPDPLIDRLKAIRAAQSMQAS
ncbi:MAG TPA: DUF433 domain-containing protein [Tepidisphaeraceae bacterium]|nr:DUF433 domain-containing protein [Tepidisphaeraceae bacterium]